MTPFTQDLINRMPGPGAAAQLRSAVIDRLAMGATREAMLADLNDLREVLDAQGEEDREEAVLTVMDCLVGFCSPFMSLSRIGRSENDEDTDDVAYDAAEE